jgi:ferric-dicitrate binding protein FerR (iron transport regulator)
MRKVLFHTLVWTIVLTLATAPAMADLNAAMLHAKGKATVNGNAVSNSQAVFAGDQVRTGKDSSATLTLAGSIVTLPSESGVVFGNNALAVNEGGVTITTSRGMTVTAGGLRIQPADGQKGRFEVTQSGGRVRVSALQGRLAVSDGKQTTMIEPGHQMTTAGSSLGNKPAAASSLSGAALAVIVAVVAGASVGAIIATTGEEADTSPSTFQ